MAIDEHIQEFAGFPVQEFDLDEGLADPSGTAYRVSDLPDGTEFVDLWARLLDDPQSCQLRALVIGTGNLWSERGGDGEELNQQLIEASSWLTALEALFLGDITGEEWEISWIRQGNVGPVLAAYPRLSHFVVRGGEGLQLQPLSQRPGHSAACGVTSAGRHRRPC